MMYSHMRARSKQLETAELLASPMYYIQCKMGWLIDFTPTNRTLMLSIY